MSNLRERARFAPRRGFDRSPPTIHGRASVPGAAHHEAQKKVESTLADPGIDT
jgi:hypothetical protein